jgi:hypothetical protein
MQKNANLEHMSPHTTMKIKKNIPFHQYYRYYFLSQLLRMLYYGAMLPVVEGTLVDKQPLIGSGIAEAKASWTKFKQAAHFLLPFSRIVSSG